MYRISFVLLMLTAKAFGASITPAPEPTTPSTDHSLSNPSTSSDLRSTGFTPSQAEVPRLPLSQYYYPTYPEYIASNDSEAASKKPQTELIPSTPPRYTGSWLTAVTGRLIPYGHLALAYGVKGVVFVFQLAVISVIGLILTTSLCTFTPFCNISFAGLDLTQHQVKEQVTEMARAYITPENLDTVTEFAMKAIEKYSQFKASKQN